MISRSSEYAIRALTYLASQPPDSFHLAQDMARELGIPPAFLGKVLQPLVTAGILGSQRGRGGGFRLARKPAEVHLTDIIVTQENLDRSRQCVLGQGECSDAHACPLHSEWRSRTDSFLHHLETTTLADLLRYQRDHSNCSYPYPNTAVASTAPPAAPAPGARGGAGSPFR